MTRKNAESKLAARPNVRKFSPGIHQSDEEIIEQFVVRNHELGIVLEVLRGNIHSPSCQHVLIVAPRGRGKTMLLARTAAELRTNGKFSEFLLPVHFMEESQEIFNLADFWLETLFHLAREIATHDPELAQELRETHAALTDRWHESELGDLARSAVLMAADRLDRKLVLMVENLQALCESVNKDFGWKLREVLQSEPKIILVASATSRFESLDDVEQPFFELFRIINLERLTTEDCRCLWGAVSGKETSSREIRPLEILTGGSPRLLIIIAGFTQHGSMRQLMEELVKLIDEHTEYFRSHLESLPRMERRVYLAVIDLWRPSKPSEIATRARMDVRNVSTMLGRLIVRGAIIAEGSGKKRLYVPAEHLYSIYYKLRRERDEAAVVKNLIYFMAVFYGESELSEMSGKLIAEAIKSKAIREGIERAFAERSRIKGSSLNKEWQTIGFIREQLLFEKEIDTAFEEKDFRKVVETVNLAIASQNASQPTIPELLTAKFLLKKIVAYEQLEDFEDAITTCNDMFEHLGESETSEVKEYIVEAMMRKGNAQRELEHFEGAVAEYNKIIENFDGSETPVIQQHVETAFLFKGITGLMLGRWEDSIAAYEEVIKRLGNSDESSRQIFTAMALVGKGSALRALKNFETAIAACDETIERFSDSKAPEIQLHVTIAMINKAETQIKLRCPKDALHICEKVEQRLTILDEEDSALLAWQIMCIRTTALMIQRKNTDAMDAFRYVYDKFIPDNKMMMFGMTSFIAAMAAIGLPEQDLIEVLSSDDTKSSALKPMIIALQTLKGKHVQAPKEMLEVATDIGKFIEEEKAEYREYVVSKNI